MTSKTSVWGALYIRNDRIWGLFRIQFMVQVYAETLIELYLASEVCIWGP